MYHELVHDILNLDDLDAKTWNEGKLMYPEISSYENKTMDDFIERNGSWEDRDGYTRWHLLEVA